MTIIDQLKSALVEKNYARIVNLLPKLFQAEKDGLIVELPCKVGDTVYVTYKTITAIRKCVVNKIRSTFAGTDFALNLNENKAHITDWEHVEIKDFGKTVFLTREAAEKALKESES